MKLQKWNSFDSSISFFRINGKGNDKLFLFSVDSKNPTVMSIFLFKPSVITLLLSDHVPLQVILSFEVAVAYEQI
jgi:hypothetical protein